MRRQCEEVDEPNSTRRQLGYSSNVFRGQLFTPTPSRPGPCCTETLECRLSDQMLNASPRGTKTTDQQGRCSGSQQSVTSPTQTTHWPVLSSLRQLAPPPPPPPPFLFSTVSCPRHMQRSRIHTRDIMWHVTFVHADAVVIAREQAVPLAPILGQFGCWRAMGVWQEVGERK